MNRPTWHLRALLLITAILLSGCLEFLSIEQPSSVLPGELVTVRIAATAASTYPTSEKPYFGVCLPRGWTIPGDTFSYTGVCQGTIRYDPNLSREQENLSPAPEGYYWWVGAGGDYVETLGGAVFAEVPIQPGLPTGRYWLDYLLVTAPTGGGLLNAQRSDNHVVEIVNEFTPRELKASVQGNAVVLTWLPPLKSEGLAGYRAYRDGQLVYTGPAQSTEVLDEDLAAGVIYYSASALYADADEQLTPYEIKALIFSGGTGEPNDPYQLGRPDQLVCLADNPDLWDKAFLLVNDIDLDPNQSGRMVFTQAVIPVFSGIFDGGGHVISHLVIQGGQKNLGLFGSLTGEAKVRNLGVVDANVTGSTGTVGGLVGYNEGSIGTSYSSGSVHGNGSVGGLVGENRGTIVTSHSTGSVSGTDDVGGLVGRNEGSIVASYGSGSVSGTNHVGGLMGWNEGGIAASYSTGSVRGTRDVGGLVGQDRGSIAMSYSIASVSGTESVGGLAGYSDGGIHSSFWDIQTSGWTTSYAGTGLTTAEMQNMETFLRAGWDFVEEVANGTCDYWQISPGDYPRLHYPDGDRPLMPAGRGTAEQPYLIRDVRDLGTVWFEPRAYYRLAQSVDLSGIRWSMGVIPWFGGNFDGSGRMVRHLHIKGGCYLGLFGYLDSTARVSNLGLAPVEVGGIYSLGSLAGMNLGSIVASYSSGSVSGTGDVGGLVGRNTGRITSSYGSASVYGTYRVGGLVGGNWSSIAASYSSGSVSGTDDVGGLVGYNAGNIDSSCWDVQTSGKSGSAGGAGLTTGEMMDPQMLGLNGLANDPNWVLDGGRDYPRLVWEGTAGSMIPEPDMGWLEGRGMAEDPYQLKTADQLILISKASILWDKNLVLGADIDLDPTLPGGRIFRQAFIPVFAGGFEGGGHTISHLRIEGGQNLGLFGDLTGEAEVRNVGIVDARITGSGGYIGGLVGRNQGGRIAMSSSTGAISGTDNVGGLVGQNYGSIVSSHSSGSVSGTHTVGGLVGDNSGAITNSYSSGSVSGHEYVGGLVGYSSVGSIMASFWDTQTSGRTTSADGTGKTTAEMQTAKTFLDDGWDFVGETANGTEDIWWIDEGKDYPRLSWESEKQR